MNFLSSSYESVLTEYVTKHLQLTSLTTATAFVAAVQKGSMAYAFTNTGSFLLLLLLLILLLFLPLFLLHPPSLIPGVGEEKEKIPESLGH